MRILSFDLEDWFHILDHPATADESKWLQLPGRVEEGVKRILDMLDEGRQKATFFCLGWVAERHPRLIKEVQNRGHEIGTHSYAHQLVYKQSQGDFKNDLVKSIAILEDITGEKVRMYRAPGFSITEATPWAYPILAEAGIEVDSSVFPSSRAHGGFSSFPHAKPCMLDINGYRMLELPMNTAKTIAGSLVFSGGGYFRLFPLSLIRHYSKKSDYVMTYFHPRDFDPGQPMIPDLPVHRKFKSYVGLKGALQKLSKWIGTEEFITIGQAEKLLNTGELVQVKIT